MAYQQYLGQFYLDSLRNNFSCGANAVTLTVGNYYITTLVDHMQTQIRALGGGYADAVVSYSGTTGFVTLNSTVSETITWTDSGLQTLLGFTGTQSGASTYTATKAPRYVWRPTMDLADYPGDATNFVSPRSTTSLVISPDGTCYSTVGNTLYDGSYAYVGLPVADVITTSTTTWESLEEFFKDVIANGKPIRCYPDRTAAGYVTCMWIPTSGLDSEDPITVGAFADYKARMLQSYNGYWNVQFALKKYA